MARMTADQIHTLLARDDKVSLGGNGRVIWAPEFPQHADVPGFWDTACYLEHRLDRLFAVTLLFDNQREVPLKVVSRRWTPDRLIQTYEIVDGLAVTEDKTYLDDVLVSRLTVRATNGESARLHAIVWTLQPRGDPGKAGSTQDEAIRAGHIELVHLRPGMFDAGPQAVAVAIGADRPPRSYSLNASEGGVSLPRWELTPFHEKLTEDGLPGDLKPTGGAWGQRPEHRVYAGMEYALEVPAGAEVSFTAGAALAADAEKAAPVLAQALSDDPLAAAAEDWSGYWASVPSFRCDDPYLERAYWYRWFGLRLNTVRAGSAYNLPYPCVFEGINHGWFRHAISYSAQAVMRDLRWMHEPEVAQGCLLNFEANQLLTGAFPGGISTTPVSTYGGFYHANWGTAVRKLHQVHADRSFLEHVYRPLSRYATHFQERRDPEGWHLYDVIDHWETGQEYMSRYALIDDGADRGGPIRLKAIDATCYLYELYQALEWMAKLLDHVDEATEWARHAAATAKSVRERLWDSEINFFTDLDPRSGKLSRSLAAVGFYPFMSDLAGPEHLSAIQDHLFNPAEFWTDYPVPSTALADSLASAQGEWKDLRTNCPWNGRSWLMTNSHVCEALAHAAYTLDSGLRDRAAELIRRCIYEMFIDGDVNRATSYEYYNPINGKAPFFRGTDDYMHSWVIDLIIQYVAGIQPQDNTLVVVDPLPLGLKRFELEDAQVKGHALNVRWAQGEGLVVEVDGVETARRDDLGRIELHIGM